MFDWAPGDRKCMLSEIEVRDIRRSAKRASAMFLEMRGPAFVEAFIANRSRSLGQVEGSDFRVRRAHASGTDGQVQRVARVFGLLGAAGELAVEYGIVPWPQGNAIASGEAMFEAGCSNEAARRSEVTGRDCSFRLVIERDGKFTISSTIGR